MTVRGHAPDTGPESLERIQLTSLKTQVTELLQSQIISGELRPDGIYSANAISMELGISTGPVREAFLALAEQGLVQAVRNRGFRVIALTDQDRVEIHEMRRFLEIPAMRKLAGNTDIHARAGYFRQLAEDTVRTATAQDLTGYLKADLRFHLELLYYCNNARLVRQVQALRLHTRQHALAQRIANQQMFDTAAEHFDLLDAILDDEPERLEQLMEKHLDHINTDWAEN